MHVSIFYTSLRKAEFVRMQSNFTFYTFIYFNGYITLTYYSVKKKQFVFTILLFADQQKRVTAFADTKHPNILKSSRKYLSRLVALQQRNARERNLSGTVQHRPRVALLHRNNGNWKLETKGEARTNGEP